MKRSWASSHFFAAAFASALAIPGAASAADVTIGVSLPEGKTPNPDEQSTLDQFSADLCERAKGYWSQLSADTSGSISNKEIMLQRILEAFISGAAYESGKPLIKSASFSVEVKEAEPFSCRAAPGSSPS